MPPLQDITHRFISPLPPSSPALSYIDEGDIVITNEHPRTEPSSAFLALSTSSVRPPAASVGGADYDKENKENISPFDLGDEFDDDLNTLAGPSRSLSRAAAAVFATPKKGGRADGSATSTPSSDPFGFLAVERKLKLERSLGKRRDCAPELEHASKRQKPTPSTRGAKSRVVTPSTSQSRVKSIFTVAKANAQTRTPVPQNPVDVKTLTPPSASSFHIEGRKRRRETLTFPSDIDGNLFTDSHASTPSPLKRYPHPTDSPVIDLDQGGDKDENVQLPLSPTVQLKQAAPGRNQKPKRKRVRVVEEDDVGNQTLSVLADDPELLATVLQSRLPKRQRKKKENRTRRKKVDRDEDEGTSDEKEGEKTRRSARLAVRGPPAANVRGEKVGGKLTVEVGKIRTRSIKGKENAGKKVKAKTVKTGTNAAAAATRAKSRKPASKAKENELEEESDNVKEKWERERAERRAYFERLDSYELETENIYVI